MAPTTRHLEQAAGLLALVVAAVHLDWSIPRFVTYASVGVMPDPRPLLFVLSGHAIALAITLVALGVVDARRFYVPGIGLMLAHLVGYVAWHTVLDHGLALTPAAPGHTHSHLAFTDALLATLGHLPAAPLELVSKLAELTVVILLAVLYGRARRD